MSLTRFTKYPYCFWSSPCCWCRFFERSSIHSRPTIQIFFFSGFGDIVPLNVDFFPATLAYIILGLIITTMCIGECFWIHRNVGAISLCLFDPCLTAKKLEVVYKDDSHIVYTTSTESYTDIHVCIHTHSYTHTYAYVYIDKHYTYTPQPATAFMSHVSIIILTNITVYASLYISKF